MIVTCSGLVSTVVLGDIDNLIRRYDIKNITIQLYPQYCLYGDIQKNI